MEPPNLAPPILVTKALMLERTACPPRMEADKLEELRQKVVDIREQHRHRAGPLRDIRAWWPATRIGWLL